MLYIKKILHLTLLRQPPQESSAHGGYTIALAAIGRRDENSGLASIFVTPASATAAPGRKKLHVSFTMDRPNG
jgi:hypothetical protein